MWFGSAVHDVVMLTTMCLVCSLSLALAACGDAEATDVSSAPRPERLAPLPPLRPVVVPSTPRASASLSAEGVAVLEAALASPDWMVRLTATQALLCLPHPSVVSWLEQRLGDVEPDVRAAAVHSLGGQTTPYSKTLLRSVQNDTTEELSIRVLATSALARPLNPCQ